MPAAIPEHEPWHETSTTRTPSGFPTPGVIVGAEATLGSEPPGLSRVGGMAGAPESEVDQWVALGIDLRGLAPLDARRSLAWVQERLARGEAFRLDEHEEEVELIRDYSRIAQVIEALLAREARGYAMRIGADPGVTHSVPARLTAQGSVLLDGQGGPLEPPFDVQLEGFHSVYQFQWSGDPVAAPPDTIVRVRRRRQRRARAPFRLRARFTHPLWDAIQVNAPVSDVSLEGLSLDTDAFRDLLYPGLVLRDLEIYWKGGMPIRCGAMVRHVTQHAHSGRHRVGLSLDLPPLAAALWQREIEGVLHPHTLRGGHGSEVFWENYTASGYFNLSGKRAEDFEGLRASFDRTHKRLRKAPHIGAAFAYSSERRVESVCHQVSPWEGTWVLYHFSRRPDGRPLSAAGDDALLDLYSHAYEYVQQQSRAEYLVTYVQKVARFSSLIFNDLTRRYLVSGRTSITEFRALEMATDVPAKKNDRFEIGPARQDELVLASAVIRASRPKLYVDATGLGQVDLGIDSTVAAWSTSGLERDRRLLVARHGGRVVAAAVVDIVEQGMHLFGLFDLVRLFPVSSLGHLAFGALLDETRRLFRALGRARFAYFCDDTEDRSGPQRAGTTDLGEATMTILPVGLLPELLEHVYVLTSRRPASGSLSGSELPGPRSPSELPPAPGAE